MPDAERFARLSVPFGIMGAAAGWLSSNLVLDPRIGYLDVRGSATITAALLGAVAGGVVRLLVLGRQYPYELSDADPTARSRSDRSILHGATILAAGAATGAIVGTINCSLRAVPGLHTLEGTIGGTTLAALFIPVALAVVAAARRAQRARLGSLVAASDRRSIWSVLAATLGVATLESVPGLAFGTPRSGLPGCTPAWALLAIAIVTVALARRADRRARRRAEVIAGANFSVVQPDEHEGVAQIDLGLGAERGALFPRSGAAYRDGGRAIALVLGWPADAVKALDRAVHRGSVALVVLAAVTAVHASAILAHEVARSGAEAVEGLDLESGAIERGVD